MLLFPPFPGISGVEALDVIQVTSDLSRNSTDNFPEILGGPGTPGSSGVVLIVVCSSLTTFKPSFPATASISIRA